MQPPPDDPRDLEHCKYWAFVSYSHADSPWSEWLHRALETYRVPRRLVGRPGPAGPAPKRLFPVFRDTAELPASGSLRQELYEALRSSKYLVVICSPAAARSSYVDEEVRFFSSLGRGNRILCVIVGGEPNVGADPMRAEHECFPSSARQTADGTPSHAAQPIAADARPGKDSRRDVVLRLVAGMLGMSFDELKQRDQRRRALRRAAAAAAIAAVIAAVAATWQWQEIDKRHRTIESYTAIGQRELTSGGTSKAAVYLAEAYRLGGDSVRLRLLLAQALQGLELWDKVIAAQGDEVRILAFDPHGRRLLSVRGSTRLELWDAEGVLVARLPDGQARVEAAAFSPDGSYFLTCGLDRLIHVWNASDGELRGRLGDHESLLAAVAFAPDGRRFITIGSDGSAVVWSARELRAIATLKSDVAIRPPALFSPDGAVLATLGYTGDRILLWDNVTGRPRAITLRGTVTAASLSWPMLAVATEEGTLEMLNLATDQRSGPLHSDPAKVVFLGVMSRNRAVVVVRENGQVALWEGERHRKLMEFGTGLARPRVGGFDGQRLVLLAQDPEPIVSVWDLESGSHVATVEVGGEALTSAALSPGRASMVTGDAAGVIMTWNLERRRRNLTLPGHETKVHVLTFSPDGSQVVTAGSEGVATLWDTASGSVVARLDRHRSAVVQGEFSGDGTRLVTVSADGALALWDVRTHQPVRYIPDLRTKRVAVTQAGAFLIAVRVRDDVILWAPDADTSEFLQRPRVPLQAMVFDAAGSLLALGNVDGSAEIWEVATKQLRHRLWAHHDEVTSLRFGGDSRKLLTTIRDGTAILWSLADGRELVHLRGHAAPVLSGDMSVDQRMVATASLDHTARLWDANTGRLLKSLEDHAGAVTSVAFSSDGHVLATGSDDGTVKLWETGSRKLIQTLPPHAGRVLGVAFSPRGDLLATAGLDPVARIWDLRREDRSRRAIADLMRSRSTLRLTETGSVARGQSAGLEKSRVSEKKTTDTALRASGAGSPEVAVERFVAALAAGRGDLLVPLISPRAPTLLTDLPKTDSETLKQSHEPFANATVAGTVYRRDRRAALVILDTERAHMDFSVREETGLWRIDQLWVRPTRIGKAASGARDR